MVLFLLRFLDSLDVKRSHAPVARKISTTPGLTVGQWATKLLGIRLFDLFWLLREVGMDQYLLIPFLGE